MKTYEEYKVSGVKWLGIKEISVVINKKSCRHKALLYGQQL